MQRAPGFTQGPQVRPIENPFARRPFHEFGGLGAQGFGNVPPFIDLIAPGEDFRVASTFTRNSSALRTNSAFNLENMAINQPIWDYNRATQSWRGLRMLPQRINKCIHFNLNPTTVTNVIREGDAAATISVVNDAAALAAAGLNIGNGNVYRLDNTLGTGLAAATMQGTVGNLNQHAYTAYCRCTGTGSVRRGAIGAVLQQFTNIASYQRFGGVIASSGVGDRLSINASAGAVVWFTLADLQEGSFITDPVVVAGAQATRFPDVYTITDLSWLNPIEGTFIFEYETPALTNNEVLLCLDSGINNRIVIQHGATFVNFAVVSGGVVQHTSSQNISAPSTVKVVFGYKDGDFGFSVNQGATVPGTAGSVPAVSTFRIGRDPSNVNNAALWPRRLRYCPIKLPNSMLNLL